VGLSAITDAPQQQEEGEHDGTKKGTWCSSSASAAGVVCL